MRRFEGTHQKTFAQRVPTGVTYSSHRQPFLFERRYRNNATATSPTIFIDFAETLSIVSSSVW